MGSFWQPKRKWIPVGAGITGFLLTLILLFHREIIYFFTHILKFDLSGHPGNGGY